MRILLVVSFTAMAFAAGCHLGHPNSNHPVHSATHAEHAAAAPTKPASAAPTSKREISTPATRAAPVTTPIEPTKATPVNAKAEAKKIKAETEIQKARKAGLHLRPAKRDFGRVIAGEVVSRTFTIKAPTGKPLVLGRLYSPCPCLFITADKRNLRAGETATVTVTIHSLTILGAKTFSVFIEVLEPVRVVLRGEVRVEGKRAPAVLALKPEALHLGSVRGTKTAMVRLYNLSTRPLTLKTVACSIKAVKVSALEGRQIEAGKYATIQIAVLATGLTPGTIRGVVSIETDQSTHARIEIPIGGTAFVPKK